VLASNADGEPKYVKSSKSGGTNCVEVCRLTRDHVAVRHSKDDVHMLRFSVSEWAAFTAGVKAGEFDVD